MKKVLKYIVITSLVSAVLIIGAVIALNIYMTDERLRSLLLPKVEKELGRKIDIGHIEFGIFKGITIDNFTVYEADKQNKFISAQEFIFKYQLIPLLFKQIVIDKIVLTSPNINITRYTDGKYNFDDLTGKNGQSENKSSETTEAASKNNSGGRPTTLSLLVKDINVKSVNFNFIDQKKEFPDISIKMDSEVSLNALSSDIKKMRYTVSLNLHEVTAVYQGLSTRLYGNLKGDEKNLNFDLKLGINKDTAAFKGSASDYMTNPDIKIDINSDTLSVEPYLALMDLKKKIFPAVDTKPETLNAGNEKGSQTQLEGTQPQTMKFKVKSNINIGSLKYGELKTGRIETSFTFADGTLIISKLNGDITGGSISITGKADINPKEPVYSISASLKDIHPALLAAAIKPEYTKYKNINPIIGGTLEITEKEINTDLTIGVFDDHYGLKANIQKYMTEPDVKFDLNGDHITVAPYLALASVKEKSPENAGTNETNNKKITLSGNINIGSISYEDVKTGKINTSITLKDDILSFSKLMVDIAGGSIEAQGNASIGQMKAYNISMKLKNIHAAPFIAKYKSEYKNIDPVLDGNIVASKNQIKTDMSIGLLQDTYGVTALVSNYIDNPTIEMTLKAKRISLEQIVKLISEKGAKTPSKGAVTHSKEVNKPLPRFNLAARVEIGSILYGKYNTSLMGNLNASPVSISFSTNAVINNNPINLNGNVNNYMELPDMSLSLRSNKLDVDSMLTDDKGAKSAKSETVSKGTKTSKSTEVPAITKEVLRIKGSIDIDNMIYKKALINNFKTRYTFTNNVLTIQDIGGRLAGGTFKGSSTIDLRQAGYLYSADLNASSIKVKGLLDMYAPDLTKYMSGDINMSAKIKGSGTVPETIKKTLNGDGSFDLINGSFKDHPMLSKFASFVKVDHLKTIYFKKCNVNFTINNGNINHKAIMDSTDLKIDSSGQVNMITEGLNIDTETSFSPELTKLIANNSSFAQYFTDESGRGSLPITIRGTISNPSYGLDMNKIGKRAAKKIEKTLEKSINKDTIKKASDKIKVPKGLKNLF